MEVASTETLKLQYYVCNNECLGQKEGKRAAYKSLGVPRAPPKAPGVNESMVSPWIYSFGIVNPIWIYQMVFKVIITYNNNHEVILSVTCNFLL